MTYEQMIYFRSKGFFLKKNLSKILYQVKLNLKKLENIKSNPPFLFIYIPY